MTKFQMYKLMQEKDQQILKLKEENRRLCEDIDNLLNNKYIIDSSNEEKGDIEE